MAAPWVAAAVQGGTGLVSPIMSNWSNANQNRKNRNFAVNQYWQEQQDQYNYQKWRDERDDSVWNRQNEYDQKMWNQQNVYDQQMWDKQNAYNEKRWNIQNQYDSPAAQMQRFREAGLNPHLIYGQMGNGGSIATAQMDTSARPSASTGHSSGSTPHASWQGRPSDWSGLSSGIMGIWDAYQKNVQTDNLKTANQLAKEEIALTKQEQIKKSAETGSILANTANSKYDLDWKNSIRSLSLDALKESLRGSKITNDLSLQKNEREAVQQGMNLKEATERIINMRGERLNKAADTELKQQEIYLRQHGIFPNDPFWWRKLAAAVEYYQNKKNPQTDEDTENMGRVNTLNDIFEK